MPFLWWVRAQLRIDQEFLADLNVVTLTGSPAGYATRLVTLAADPTDASATRLPVESGSSRSEPWEKRESHSPLLQRVLMLLHCPYPLEQKPPRWWTLSAPLLVVALAVMSAFLSFVLVERISVRAQASVPGNGLTTFQVKHFVASPQPGSSHGRSPFYTLPLRLPAEFDLSVDIHASPSALSRIRIVGIALGNPGAADVTASRHAGSDSTTSDWHQVRICRRSGRVSITVDGRTRTLEHNSETVSDWLTLEPALDETAILRDLRVMW